MSRLKDLGEFGVIRRIAHLVQDSSNLLVGIGDDCAIYRAEDGIFAVTSDLLIQDVHFRFCSDWAEDIGWKAAAVNLSDIAAMGARPLFATVSCGAPGDMLIKDLESVYRGLIDCLSGCGAVLAGGDTTRSDGPLILDMSVIGDAAAGYVTRAAASAGDVIAVTGYPGRSAAGLQAQESDGGYESLCLAHRRPMPRVLEGQWLGQHATAMIDVSDGLAQDAGHIAEASKVAIDFDAESIPVSDDLQAFADDAGLEAQSFALAGGEDYELLVALNPKSAKNICESFARRFTIPLTIVGRCAAGDPCVRVNGEAVDASGFDHFREF